MIVVLTSFGIAAILVNVFVCKPVGYISLPHYSIPGVQCINIALWFYFAASITILTDFIVVAIPMIVLKDLNIAGRQKFALMFVFLLGILYETPL